MDRRLARTRKSIMDALISLSRTENLDSLSVARIAERADINRVTFYAHFSDLDDVVEAAAAGVIEEAGKAMAEPYKDDTAYGAVERNIRAFLAKAEEGRPLFAWIGNSSRRARLHDLVFRSLRSLALERARELGAAEGGTEALFIDYIAAGCARLLMDFLMTAQEPDPAAKESFMALLPRLWLPSVYGALGIGDFPAERGGSARG